MRREGKEAGGGRGWEEKMQEKKKEEGEKEKKKKEQKRRKIIIISLNFIPFKTVTHCISTMIPMIFAFILALHV